MNYSEKVINKVMQSRKLKNKAQFAAAVGVTPTTVYKWAANDCIDLRKVVEACDDFDLNWLLRTNKRFNEFTEISKSAESVEAAPQQQNEDGTSEVEYLRERLKTVLQLNASLTRMLELSITKKADQ